LKVFFFSLTKPDKKTLPTGRARTRGILGERENEERSCQKTGAGERVSGIELKYCQNAKLALIHPECTAYQTKPFFQHYLSNVGRVILCKYSKD